MHKNIRVATDLENLEIREIKIGHGNREKSGKNVKTSGISKFVHNFLKLFLFQIIVIIFLIYLTFIVQNLRTLNFELF